MERIAETYDAKRRSLQDDIEHVERVIAWNQFEDGWTIDDEIQYSELLSELRRDHCALERHELKPPWPPDLYALRRP